MTDYPIHLFFSNEDGGYIAEVPDLQACSPSGTTPEEALAEVEKAKEARLAAAPGLRRFGLGKLEDSACSLPCHRGPDLPGYPVGEGRKGAASPSL